MGETARGRTQPAHPARTPTDLPLAPSSPHLTHPFIMNKTFYSCGVEHVDTIVIPAKMCPLEAQPTAAALFKAATLLRANGLARSMSSSPRVTRKTTSPPPAGGGANAATKPSLTRGLVHTLPGLGIGQQNNSNDGGGGSNNAIKEALSYDGAGGPQPLHVARNAAAAAATLECTPARLSISPDGLVVELHDQRKLRIATEKLLGWGWAQRFNSSGGSLNVLLLLGRLPSGATVCDRLNVLKSQAFKVQAALELVRRSARSTVTATSTNPIHAPTPPTASAPAPVPAPPAPAPTPTPPARPNFNSQQQQQQQQQQPFQHRQPRTSVTLPAMLDKTRRTSRSSFSLAGDAAPVNALDYPASLRAEPVLLRAERRRSSLLLVDEGSASGSLRMAGGRGRRSTCGSFGLIEFDLSNFAESLSSSTASTAVLSCC